MLLLIFQYFFKFHFIKTIIFGTILQFVMLLVGLTSPEGLVVSVVLLSLFAYLAWRFEDSIIGFLLVLLGAGLVFAFL